MQDVKITPKSAYVPIDNHSVDPSCLRLKENPINRKNEMALGERIQ